MIGTNNNGDEPKDIAEGIRRIIATISEKHPESKIILLPIFPRGADANDVKRRRNESVNAIIRAFADGEKVIWVDFNDKLVDEKGDTRKFMDDRLHTNHDGYGVWREAVVPYFRDIVGR
jgi:lysophospholipase L1-like esterase